MVKKSFMEGHTIMQKGKRYKGKRCYVKNFADKLLGLE